MHSHFNQVLYDLCFYLAQITGECLQDHWSSGLNLDQSFFYFLFLLQVISLDVNLSAQKDRVAELERELRDLRQQGTIEGAPEGTEVKSKDQLRVQELEMERASLKQELSV